jgi:hypothetical protein
MKFLHHVSVQHLHIKDCKKKLQEETLHKKSKSTKLYLDCHLNLVEGVVHMEEGVGTEAALYIVY